VLFSTRPLPIARGAGEAESRAPVADGTAVTAAVAVGTAVVGDGAQLSTMSATARGTAMQAVVT